MTEARYARYGALTGVVAIVLFVVGGAFLVFPPAPAPDASAASFATYFTDHRDAIRVATLIFSVGLFFFLWFLGSLWVALREVAASARLPLVAIVGGVVVAMFLIVATTLIATAAYRPDQTSPELTRALNDVGILVAGTATAGFLAMLGATGLTLLRSDAYPAWLGWLNLAGAFANLGTLGFFFIKTGAFGPGGPLGGLAAIAGFVFPVAALSIVITRRLALGVGEDAVL
jgi:hypothetical protein